MTRVSHVPNLSPDLAGRFVAVCGLSIYASHFDELGNLLSMRTPDFEHSYATEAEAQAFADECTERNRNPFTVARLEVQS